MLTFSVAPEAIEPDYIEKVKKSNGLFRLLQMGYSDHVPITIRPDDVLNTVVCIWSKYVTLNAEKFRQFFVTHEDKKTLTYRAGGTYRPDRLGEFMDGLIALVKGDQENDNMSWAQASCTTTQPVDHLVRAAALLASQKEFYEFRVHLCCGFSRVRLEGTDADWAAVEFAIQSMPTPDEPLADWQAALLQVIHNMRSGDEDFWQKCVSRIGFGSGPRNYNGWILVFNPINEKGEWMEDMENDDILDLTVDFPIVVNDHGHEFQVNVEAGSTELQIRDDMLAVKNVFSIQEADKPAMTFSE